MFESLENRQCMSATLEIQMTTPPPTQPTVMALGESPEQAAKAAAKQGPLSRGVKDAIFKLLIDGLK